ncbi:30S ribosomal protein S6 [Patescibacteria group bacterium]
MQHYEMLFILSSRQTQEELESKIQEIFQIVEKLGGNLTKKEVFSKQRFAYPIKKEEQGVYIISEFDIDPEKLQPIDQELRHTPGILRHQIVSVQVKSPERIEAERALKEKVATKRATDAQKKKQEEISKEVKKAEELPEKKDEKINVDELDKKLEELLDDPLLKE